MNTPELEHNETLVRRLYEECMNTGNFDLLPELMAADFVGSKGEIGIAEYVKSVQPLHLGFPNIRFSIEDIFAGGDRVAVRWVFTGTHQGNFAGVPASHRAVVQTGNVIFRVREGLLAQVWAQVDRLGLLQQMRGEERK